MEIPGSLLIIPSNAFEGCNNLKEVVICEGVETIDGFAFNACTSLEKVSIPDTVAQINNYAFDECFALKDVEVEEEAVVGDNSFPENVMVKRRKGTEVFKQAKLQKQKEAENRAKEAKQKRASKKIFATLFCVVVLSLGVCWYAFYVIDWAIILQILWFIFIAPFIISLSCIKFFLN